MCPGPPEPGGIDVAAADVAALHARGAVELIDVREPYEWAAGRIAGARHVPVSALAAEAATIARERPVVFYCRVGARSAMAADAFRHAGFHAFSLAGGLLAWAAEGRPLDPEGGAVAPH
jgi:hydroxyacylglutathione hydrolase/adenylyltransferase/sulfurtransferase